MKKFWIALIAVSVVFMMVLPAMATNVTFSGSYRVRGHWVGDSDLSDEDSVSNATWNPRRNDDNAWYDMRFRMSTVFEVSERLSVHTRLDALDKTWGTPDHGHAVTTDDNIDIDRIWMSIKSDWGLWEIGRMNTGVWGTSWVDAAADSDRIKYTLPVGNFALIAIIQKVAEADNTQGYSNADTDAYQLAGVYSAENWTAGLLVAYIDQDSNSETAHAAPAVGTIPFEAEQFSFLPYFTGQFGAFGISTELRYNNGEVNVGSADALINGFDTDDYDIDAWAWNLELTYEMGPLTFQGGYSFLSGDDDLTDDDLDGFAQGAADWEKSLILAGGGPQGINTWQQTRNAAATGGNLIGLDDGVYGALNTAGVGTASAAQTGFAAANSTPGAHIFYLGADYAATEALSFSFLYMYAFADDEFSGWDDDYGHEVNLGLSYDIYENLTYSASFGYLFTGDFWEGGNAAADAAEGLTPNTNGVGSGNEDDMWVLTHSLVLSF